MSKCILIGQAPGGEGDPSKPLEGAAGLWLADLCSIEYDRYLELYERANLLDYRPRFSEGKGDDFPLHEARLAVPLIVHRLNEKRVVFLGRGVCSAFGVGKANWFDWHLTQLTPDDNVEKEPVRFSWCAAPHPSRVSHWWNDPENLGAARKFWTDLTIEIDS